MQQHEEEHHLVNPTTYILVWLGLLVFTGLTVAVAGFDFKSISILVVLFIAASKSSLVLYYFMHLKYERPLFKVMFFLTILTIAIFVVLTFSDTAYR